MELAPLTFTAEQAAEIVIKARNCLTRIAGIAEPLTDSAKRYQFVLDEVAEAEKEAREAAGNDFEVTKQWTRETTIAAEKTLADRCRKLRDEVNKAYELAFDLRACINHLAEPEKNWSEILPAGKTVLMMLSEYIEARGDRHFPSALAEAFHFMTKHPTCIFRIPNLAELARMAKELDIQTSTRRDDSNENRRRLADRHDVSPKEVSRIANYKRKAA